MVLLVVLLLLAGLLFVGPLLLYLEDREVDVQGRENDRENHKE